MSRADGSLRAARRQARSLATRRAVLVLALAGGLALLALAAGGAGTADAAPTVTVEQHSPGNVFLANETVRVGLASDADAVRWSIRRYGGERVATGTVQGANETLTPDLRVGHYTLRAWPAGTHGAATETTLAVLPTGAARAEDPFYGITANLGAGANEDDALLKLMDDAGVASVRMGYDWHEVERERGRIDFGDARNPGHPVAVDERGLHSLQVVGYGNPAYGGRWNHAPHTDAYRRAYVEYARALAREHPDTDAYEIWNEYNIVTFSTGPAGTDPAAYETLVERTAPALREERPDATIVVGATAPTGKRVDWPFWRGYFDAGGGDHGDVYSIHLYRDRPTDYRSDVERLRAMSRERAGTTKPIWATEFGWSTALQGPDTVDEPTQARYAVQSHVRLQAAGVERAHWFNFRDDGRPGGDNPQDLAGFVRHPDAAAGSYTPKPSLAAYATMTSQLAGKSHVEATESPVPTHVYRGNGTTTRVLWAPWTGQRRTLSLRTDEPLTVTTMTGERHELHPYRGNVTLSVGHDPVYVEGPVDGVSTGAPFGFVDAGAGNISLAVRNDGDATLTTTHRVGDRETTVTAGAGANTTRTLPVPSAYRTERPTVASGAPVITDVVSVDGDPVALLEAEVAVEPRTTQPDTATPRSGWARAPETDGSPNSSTTDAGGPGFGVLAAVAALLAVTGAFARRRS